MSPTPPTPTFDRSRHAETDLLQQLRDGYQHCSINESRLILTVSGGLDSVTLLHATHRLLQAAVTEQDGSCFSRATSLLVVHVHHHLRGRESDLDAALVA
ncbi:MAG: hypothetical protein KDA85_01795, partial [Planctomycetaceae bacterium]|nr:hypothetical protein [Planctomycetaceae bacterium]